jgi:hypothetical protein
MSFATQAPQEMSLAGIYQSGHALGGMPVDWFIAVP